MTHASMLWYTEAETFTPKLAFVSCCDLPTSHLSHRHYLYGILFLHTSPYIYLNVHAVKYRVRLLKDLWFGCFSFRGKTTIAWRPEVGSTIHLYSFYWSTLYADYFEAVLPTTSGRSEQPKSWVLLWGASSLRLLWTVEGENITLSFSGAAINLISLSKINLDQRSSRLSHHPEMVVYSFSLLLFLPFQRCKSLPSSMSAY